jgi:zinc protease
MRKKGPKAEELQKAKTYLCGLYPLRLETNESLGGAIADTWVNGLGDDYLQRYRSRVMEVPLPRAAALSARWFLPEDGRTIAVVGKAEEVVPQLEGLGAIERWKVADLG